MISPSVGRVRREALRIRSVQMAGWEELAGHTPKVGDVVRSVDGEGEVVKVLGKTSDGSRLLEIRLADNPKQAYFASSSNVLVRTDETLG